MPDPSDFDQRLLLLLLQLAAAIVATVTIYAQRRGRR